MKLLIEPFVGFGDIYLGLSQKEVQVRLGEPQSVDSEGYSDGTTNKIFKYPNLEIELTFSSEDDFRLSSITFESVMTEFKGLRLIGLSEEGFLARADKLKIRDLVLESDFQDLNSKDYVIDSLGLSVWIQDGKVDSISLFPRYEDDNETVIWPEFE
ncbi:hypothetical protein [Marinoscillum pacificum]|uniref:hypothetical protein n=1 Tax=Marinoscillum pacificum TaxID=392723 RepID=UPI002157BFB3|nr:hypothetical protein [Marinoscillum pacificum]